MSASPTEGTDMNQIEKALSDYLGDMCGMRLKPHALTGLAKVAIAAMQPTPQEPVAWMYESAFGREVCKFRWGWDEGLTRDHWAGWTETPLYVLPTPPAGGSDAE